MSRRNDSSKPGLWEVWSSHQHLKPKSESRMVKLDSDTTYMGIICGNNVIF